MANLAMAFIIGLVIPTFAADPSAFWRLLLVIGFLGALRAASTFTAEIFVRLRKGRQYRAFGEIFIHMGGALIMNWLGAMLFLALRHIFGGAR